MKSKAKALPILLSVLMAISLLALMLPSTNAALDSGIFNGNTSYTISGAFTNTMQYGYHVALYSTLQLPSDWYLDYTMGFYLMDASNNGYYIGFHQYRGAAQIYVNPVSGGVYYGLDGQPYHYGLVYSVASLFNLMVTLDYNSTTGDFAIKENGAVLVSNNFSGLELTNYKVENPLGRDQISGNVHMLAYGADNADGSYNNVIYNGIDFEAYTDGEVSTVGGTLTWTHETTLGIGGGETGGVGYNSTVFGNGDTAVVTATANPGYVFESYFVGTNFTGQFYAPGYYDLSGRLIASLDFLHLYATEPGRIVDVGTGGITSSQTGVVYSQYGWENATSTPYPYALMRVSGAYYDLVSNWDAWWGATPTVVPQSCGIYTNNPANFQYWGGNYTIIASFVSINYNPNSIGGPTTSPSPTSTAPFNFGINFSTGINSLIMSVIGAILVFIAVLLYMKVHAAWMPATILLLCGFFLNIGGQPNLIGLVGFSLEIILFSVFLYAGNGNKGK